MQRIAIASIFAIAAAGCSSLGGDLSRFPLAPQTSGPAAARDLVEPPEVVSSGGSASFNLETIINPTNGYPTFFYENGTVAPTIRVKPGDTISIDLSDDLPPAGPPSDINLHFHGFGSSPMRPEDDVLTMLARPGGSLNYAVKVPANQPPGLYWYHPHVHGETNYQVGEAGMSGAIVVEGIAQQMPVLAKMPERILIIRNLGTFGAGEARHNDGAPKGGMAGMAASSSPAGTIANTHPCGPAPVGDYLTVNDSLKPTIRINRGESQFFRIINATGHRNIDLRLDDIPMHIVAIDGYPINTFPGAPPTLVRSHFVVPPAGRVEFFATGNAGSEMRARCFDSGPIGDPDPPQILAHLRPGTGARPAAEPVDAVMRAANVPPSLPVPVATRIVRLSEDAKGFYINGQAFSPTAAPMFVVHTGTVERWKIVNTTGEVHDFHMHQVHFLVVSADGGAVDRPYWRDMAVVPPARKQQNGTWKPGLLVVIADFRSPLIRGTFLFHCHILDHEDGGMMAKVQAL